MAGSGRTPGDGRGSGDLRCVLAVYMDVCAAMPTRLRQMAQHAPAHIAQRISTPALTLTSSPNNCSQGYGLRHFRRREGSRHTR